MVRRARQFADLEIVIRSIPVASLTLMAHTDAAFANATREGTQGGYVIAAVDRAVMNDSESDWSPLVWKSSRLKRAVAATLAGEVQTLADGLGHMEWMM
eukprot:5586241-Pyramimonas_sp.AAC.1